MPEQHRSPSGPHVFTLKVAHDQGRIVRVRCSYCRITRHYLPGDLIYLVGDVGPSTLERRMRCQKCSRRGDIAVEFWVPTGQEWVGLTVRRLVGTKMIRHVYWRDEPARR